MSNSVTLWSTEQTSEKSVQMTLSFQVRSHETKAFIDRMEPLQTAVSIYCDLHSMDETGGWVGVNVTTTVHCVSALPTAVRLSPRLRN